MVASRQNFADFRMTPQRRLILKELGRAGYHLTADEVYERVRRKLPRISLGTVYRNLERLSARGLIDRVELSRQPRRYGSEPRRGDRAYLCCAKCGRSISLPFPSLRTLKEQAQSQTGRDITGVSLEFTAECIGACELDVDETEK
jgi:Fur family ferric uptake transcriptional regulator